MPATAEKLFEDTIRAMPPAERLRLAALILDDLAQPNWSIVDTRDTWSEEDLRDVMESSLRHAEGLYPEEDDVIPA